MAYDWAIMYFDEISMCTKTGTRRLLTLLHLQHFIGITSCILGGCHTEHIEFFFIVVVLNVMTSYGERINVFMQSRHLKTLLVLLYLQLSLK